MWTAEKIKQLRGGFGDTQAKFAERIGVSIDTLQNWEQGRLDAPLLAQRLFDRLAVELQKEPVAASA